MLGAVVVGGEAEPFARAVDDAEVGRGIAVARALGVDEDLCDASVLNDGGRAQHGPRRRRR